MKNLTQKELIEINGGDSGDAAYWIGYGLVEILINSCPPVTIYKSIKSFFS